MDAADAFAVDRPRGTPDDPQRWADALFRDPPSVVVGLMALREALVGLVGIERAHGDEFATRRRTDDEVLMAADARHLSFRCVVRTEPRQVVVATAVDLHGLRGRLYWAVVRHVHPPVVRAMLARSARRALDRATRPVRTTVCTPPARTPRRARWSRRPWGSTRPAARRRDSPVVADAPWPARSGHALRGGAGA